MAAKLARRQEIFAVIHVIFAHNRHWRQRARRPILIRHHPPFPRIRNIDERIEDAFALVAGEPTGEFSRAFRQIHDAALFDNRIEQRDAEIRVVHRIGFQREIIRRKDRLRRHAKFFRRQRPRIKAFHQPRHHAPGGNRIKAIHISVMIQFFGGALIENAGKRPHRLIRFVIFFKFVAHFFADRNARLAAGALLFRLNRLFVKLFEVMADDEFFMNIDSFRLIHINAAIIERNHLAFQRGEIHAERAAGLEI